MGVRAGVRINSKMVIIPREFWWDHDMAKDIIDRNGKLNRRECRVLWEVLGRTDRVPKSLQVYVNAEDAYAMSPPKH